MPGRLGRARRRLGFDRNTLRRRVDRVQWTVAIVLVTIFLAVGPLIATLVAGGVYSDGVRTERAEKQARQQVVATVLGPGEVSGSDQYVHQTVQARWQVAGEPRTGSIPAWSGAKAGDTRRIWVNDRGDPTLRPRPHSRTVADTAYTAIGVLLATGLPPLVLYGLVRHRCDRYRYARWAAEWAEISTRRIP
ncbi:hypothetical protein DPM19_22370 [Actinomadura craniellae]|uniref:Uncharacterized protein n=1 Tax=Actinomadura craniellae TaxID=2231787 RepID=A0A365H299_9ACTN|nr:hypothetical protein DPM19_22370 [Actinomadura craniellae]